MSREQAHLCPEPRSCLQVQLHFRLHSTLNPMALYSLLGDDIEVQPWAVLSNSHLELGATPVYQAPGAQTMVMGQLDCHLLHLAVTADLQLHLCGCGGAAGCNI